MARKAAKRRNSVLRGSALIRAVDEHTRNGVSKKNLFKRCGYKHESEFQFEYSKAIEARASRKLALEETSARNANQGTLGQQKARLIAQRRLADGKDLTYDEINALPDFQKLALHKSVQPFPKKYHKTAKKNKELNLPRPEPARPIGRPPRQTGKELLQSALGLADLQFAEINIAIKCGYRSEEIGIFRRELARVIGCKIAPLERLLISAKGQTK